MIMWEKKSFEQVKTISNNRYVNQHALMDFSPEILFSWLFFILALNRKKYFTQIKFSNGVINQLHVLRILCRQG